MEGLDFRQGLEPSIVCCYLVAINLALGAARVQRTGFAQCSSPRMTATKAVALSRPSSQQKMVRMSYLMGKG